MNVDIDLSPTTIPVPSFEQGPHSNTLNFLLTFYSTAIKLGNLYIVPSVYMFMNFFDEKCIVWGNKKTPVCHAGVMLS